MTTNEGYTFSWERGEYFQILPPPNKGNVFIGVFLATPFLSLTPPCLPAPSILPVPFPLPYGFQAGGMECCFVCFESGDEFTEVNEFLSATYAARRNIKKFWIRMHSSRMRTARLLPVSPNMHCPVEVPAQVPPPLPLWRDWQTGEKILPCPKLLLWAVKRFNNDGLWEDISGGIHK